MSDSGGDDPVDAPARRMVNVVTLHQSPRRQACGARRDSELTIVNEHFRLDLSQLPETWTSFKLAESKIDHRGIIS